jgi:oleate hydratase
MKTNNQNSRTNVDPSKTKVYLVGSGIASLASAVYLIKDAKVPGDNIHIMEQDSLTGGCLDGSGEEEKGYVVRGGRMHEMHYVCYWDLLSNIPSLDDSKVSITEESFAFNKKFVSNAQARLLKNGEIMDVSSFGLSKNFPLSTHWGKNVSKIGLHMSSLQLIFGLSGPPCLRFKNGAVWRK